MKKIWDTPHQAYTISNWKKYGIVSDDWKKLYYYHNSVKNCQLCNVLFDETIKNQRSLDHDHNTGLYRKTLCRGCNAGYKKASQKLKSSNKIGHMWIQRNITTNKFPSVGYRYERSILNKKIRKQYKTLTECIALSFIHLLRQPLLT